MSKSIKTKEEIKQIIEGQLRVADDSKSKLLLSNVATMIYVELDINGVFDQFKQAEQSEVVEKQVRNSVDWFSKQMERKLKKNDHKGGWRNCELQYLSMRLTQERKELTEAIASKDFQKIIDECADIANFAMMIADRFGPEFGK
jgi:glutathionyl-hydroquinone reductase